MTAQTGFELPKMLPSTRDAPNSAARLVIPEMKTVVTDFALLPICGIYTMTAKEAAEAANAFKPQAVIPMHWGDIVGAQKDADEFKRLFSGKTILKSPER